VRRSTEALITRLDEAVTADGGDWSAKLDVGTDSAWAAEVRITPDPNVRDQPDRSTVFFQAGGGVAEDALDPALRAAIADVATWDANRQRPRRWDDSDADVSAS
jgi:hypothetical protein